MLKEYLLALWETWQGKMSGIASLALTAVATWSTFFAGSTGISHLKDIPLDCRWPMLSIR